MLQTKAVEKLVLRPVLQYAYLWVVTRVPTDA